MTLPVINDLIEGRAREKFFSSVDLVAGYSQVRISKEIIPKTVFRTKYGSLESLVINLGM